MNEKLYKDELRGILRREYGMSEKEATDALNKFFNLIVKALEEERYVKVKGLGIFKLIDVESRKSVDVNTGENIEIPGHRKISYSVDSSLKELINKPFAHFETVELKEDVLLIDENLEIQQKGENTENVVSDEHSSEVSQQVSVNTMIPVEIEEKEISNSDVIDNQSQAEKGLEEELEEIKLQENDSANERPEAQSDIKKTTQMKSLNRREELRELERVMEKEERQNKLVLFVIAILMLLVVIVGMLFLLAPEILEQLFF